MPPSDHRSLETSFPVPHRPGDPNKCPIIPIELIHHLDSMEPLKMPSLDISERKLWWTVGRRSLIDYLKEEWLRQNAARL